MSRDAPHPSGNGTYFQYYWSQLSQRLMDVGLERAHSQLMAELEREGFGHSTMSKWLHKQALEELPPLPGVDPLLLQLLERTVRLHRDRSGVPIPTTADATADVVPPEFTGREAHAIWSAIVEARALASAHGGIVFPVWLYLVARDVHPFLSVISSLHRNGDNVSGRRLQYWVDMQPRRIEVVIRFRSTVVGHAVQRGLSLSLERGFVGRLFFERLEQGEDGIQIPVAGNESGPLILERPFSWLDR